MKIFKVVCGLAALDPAEAPTPTHKNKKGRIVNTWFAFLSHKCLCVACLGHWRANRASSEIRAAKFVIEPCALVLGDRCTKICPRLSQKRRSDLAIIGRGCWTGPEETAEKAMNKEYIASGDTLRVISDQYQLAGRMAVAWRRR